MRRRDFLAASAAGTGAAALGLPAGAQTLTKIRALAVPNDVSAEPYYALDRGIFKKVGLDADVSSLGNGSEIMAALIGGQVEFGSAGTTTICIGREQGLPIVAVAPAGAYSAKNRTHGLVVRADSPIRSAKDLIGKTIAVVALKAGIADVATHAYFAKEGVDFTLVQQLEVPYSAMGATLLAGRVDAIDLDQPWLSSVLALPNTRFLAAVFDVIAPVWVEGAYITTESYAKANPAIVRKFADAIALAAAWANKNGPAAWDVLDKYAKSTSVRTLPHAYYPERLSAGDFQPLIDVSAKYGAIKRAIPAQELFAPGLPT